MLFIVDYGLMKGIIIISTFKSATANQITSILIKYIFICIGIPNKIILDRDPQFIAKSIQAMFKKLNIDYTPSTAYYSQSDGSTKRFNQEIKMYLLVYCTQNPYSWPEYLLLIEFSYNSKIYTNQ